MWVAIIHMLCSTVAILLVIMLIIKLFNPGILAELTFEVLLVALAVTVLIPYISHFEALGVKIDIIQKVDNLTAWVNATPYYILANEYEEEGDYLLARRYYDKSLNLCSDFWPSIFEIAWMAEDTAEKRENPTVEDFSRAIEGYKRVLELNPDNSYSYYNLASIYLERLMLDPEKALENANKALEISPDFGWALYYRGKAQNYLGRYKKAKNSLEEIVKQKRLGHDKDLFWVYYELAVAKSNLGIQVTSKDLDVIYELAQKPKRKKKLIKSLIEDQYRFSNSDHKTIQDFIDLRHTSNPIDPPKTLLENAVG